MFERDFESFDEVTEYVVQARDLSKLTELIANADLIWDIGDSVDKRR